MIVENNGIKCEVLEIAGIMPAIKGMRNPLNSWGKNDTILKEDELNGRKVIIGNNDMILARRLISAGGEHRKFLRQISVWVDLTLPRYIWSEFDTYHYNTKNSCSTMHKLLSQDITLKDFYLGKNADESIIKVIEENIKVLNKIGAEFRKTKNPALKSKAKKILPEAFLQKRTVCTNYEELRNIYHQRKNHALREEWGCVCDFIKKLPYANEFILE